MVFSTGPQWCFLFGANLKTRLKYYLFLNDKIERNEDVTALGTVEEKVFVADMKENTAEASGRERRQQTEHGQQLNRVMREEKGVREPRGQRETQEGKIK